MPIKHEVGRFRLDSLEPSAWCLLFAAICMVYKAAGRLRAGAVYNLQNIESRVLFTHQRLPMAIQKKNI